MEWTSSYMKFYFDGQPKGSTITDDTAIAQMRSMYLILTTRSAAGLTTGRQCPTPRNGPSDTSDETTQVDWVRVWKNTSTYPSSTTWTSTSSGSWDASSNWSAGSPQLNTQLAIFGSVAASNVSIDWSNSRTVGRLVFNSSVNYTLGSGDDSIMLTSGTPITNEQPNTNTVLIDASSATGSSPNIINSRLELYNNVTIRSPNKPLTINGPITGLGSLRIESGQITLNNLAAYGGSTTIAGGTLKLGTSPVTVAHRWSFNNSLADSAGGSTATIVDVGGNNVTLSSTQATLTGGLRSSSDYIRLGSNLLPDTNTPFAIELWATPKSIQNWSRIFDFGSGTGENLLMSWTIAGNQNSDRVEWKDAVTTTNDNTNQPYNMNTEYHVVMLLKPLGSSTEVDWYVAPSASADLGVARSSFITTNTLASFLDSEDNLGRSFYSSDYTANASYNEVRFWTGPINSTILEILHDAGPNANLNSLNIGMAGGELPANTTLNLSGSSATLDLNGITQTIGSLTGVAGSSVLLGGGRLTLGGNGNSTTFSGSISGAGDIIKTGNGTFVLIGANSHSGTTYVNGGVLEIRNASALGDTTAGTIVQNGASLLVSQSLDVGNETLSLTGAGSGSGALHVASGVTVNYAGAVNLADNASIQVDASSTLDMTNPLGIGGSNKNLTFITDTGATATVNGDLDLAGGSLTKNGSGDLLVASDVLTLSSANITGGTLQVNKLHVGNLATAPGAKVIIRPTFGAPLSGPTQPVPEPSTILLLILAGTITLASRRKKYPGNNII